MIGIIGDVMLDINYMCLESPKRTAPESELVNIYNVDNVKYKLGGAANVAANLKALNCNIHLFGIVGWDMYAQKLRSLLDDQHISHDLLSDPLRQTTQKHRRFIMGENNENSFPTLIDRFDCETTKPLCSEIEDQIFNRIVSHHFEVHPWDILILSDYNKGFLTDSLCQRIISFANHHKIKTFVDPKIKNYYKYKYCTYFKPNFEEGKAMTGGYFHSPKEIINFLTKQLETENVILTAGKEGIYLRHGSEDIHFSHNEIIPVVDVTGAGDIVLAILVYVYNQCYNIRAAAQIANYIGRLSVQVIGNYIVKKDIVDKLIQSAEFQFTHHNEETFTISPIKQIIIKKDMGKTIVFTNGCFDILHAGHIKLLNFCKTQGDIVVVGINSDESVQRLKGEKRPIQTLEKRAEMLKLLPMVDYVIPFYEDTPIDLIRELSPDVLVKGGDYTIENIIGSEYAKKTIVFDYDYGKSTTNTILSVLQKMA